MAANIGVVLGQVGTPTSLAHGEIRRYLKEFLSDQRVIDLPAWRWRPILHGAVLPLRPKRVAPHYRQIWTDQGSPLLVTSRAQRDGLAERLGARYRVELGLAYSRPSIADAVGRLEAAGIRTIVVLPMFPQYSNSTTASVYDAAVAAALGHRRRRLPVKKFAPTLRFVHPFYDDPGYIRVLAKSVARQLGNGPVPDRVIVSFHGLPRRFVDEGDPYREHCVATTRLLAAESGWADGYFEMGFQSRFGRLEWIKPYLQPRLTQLAAEGVSRPAIIAPGFTTDCLETLHELGVEGRELFADGGGDPGSLRTVACLNDEPEWLDYLATLVERNAAGWGAADPRRSTA